MYSVPKKNWHPFHICTISNTCRPLKYLARGNWQHITRLILFTYGYYYTGWQGTSLCATWWFGWCLLFLGDRLYKCSAVAEMGDRLATIDMGRKLGCASLGGTGSPSNTMSSGPRPTFVPTTKWHLDPSSRFAIIDIGRKLGLCPLFGERSWVPV